MPYPLFVKAVAGGGGRGMRRVDDPEDLREAVETCMREAEGAFGDPTVFIEQAVVEPRHIEVQILADGDGRRDPPLRARLLGAAAPPEGRRDRARRRTSTPSCADRMCADAVRFATRDRLPQRRAPSSSCSTRDGNYVFIEMNPRIQVEHTVTEEITDVDLVQAQLRIASGETLADLGLTQEGIQVRGAALQCRITTEDPANNFRPDTGVITTYRSPGGGGVRLDGGTTYTGAEISAHFDSMLSKLTCRGRTFEDAVAEGAARGRGVPDPRRHDQHRVPAGGPGRPRLPGRPDHHQLHRDPPAAAQGAGQRRPRHQADDLPRRRHGQPAARRGPGDPRPGHQAARPRPRRARPRRHPPAAARARPRGVRAPAARAERRRGHRHHVPRRPPVAARDPGAQHATCSPSPVTSPAAPRSSGRSSAGAARRTTWRCASSPRTRGSGWPRCARRCRTSASRCCCAAATRSATRRTRPRSTTAFVQEAAETGLDVFRIFDALNDVEQMRPAIEAVRETGTTVAEVALCYTGDLSSPGEKLYTLDYYLRLAEQIVDAGAHVLAIKDMAGLLRAPAARTLVTALRERFDLPVHLHTHDTPGGQLGTLLAAIDAGVDAVDAACASMAGTTSQPPLSALVSRDRPLRPRDRAVARGGQRDGALLGGGAPGLRAVRVRAALPDRPGLPPRDPRRPALQPAPAGDRARARREVRADRGHVRRGQRHPRQHRQGDAVLEGGRRPRAGTWSGSAPTRPSSPRTRQVRHPRLGDRLPQRRARRPARRLAGAVPHQGARGPQLEAAGQRADRRSRRRRWPSGSSRTRRATLNELLFPGPTREFLEARETYGDVSVLPTIDYLYGLRHGEEHEVTLEEGKTIILGLQAISEPDERGYRSVMATINGQLRPISVRDRAVASEVAAAEKADPSKPGQVAAPFQGVVTTVVAEGDKVARRRGGGHHRGDEDGGLDHRPGRRHRRAARALRHPGRRGRRPGAGAGLALRRRASTAGEPGRLRVPSRNRKSRRPASTLSRACRDRHRAHGPVPVSVTEVTRPPKCAPRPSRAERECWQRARPRATPSRSGHWSAWRSRVVGVVRGGFVRVGLGAR